MPLLKLIKLVVDALSMLRPTFSPYGTKMARVTTSLRGSDADGTYLALAIAYAVALTAMFYFLTGYMLKKKRYG